MKKLTKSEQVRADLLAAQLAEIEDVQRHRRVIERISAEHAAEQRRLNDMHAKHIARSEGLQENVIRVLNDILDEIRTMRLEAKPQVVWFPVTTPHLPQMPWDNPVICGQTSTGTKTER